MIYNDTTVQWKYRLTSEYGVLEPVREGRHTGIDLGMEEGTILRSIVDGEVIQVFDEASGGALGNGVKILGEDGREYIYGHLSDVDVKVGEKLEIGSKLGEAGSTGNSTGSHLHFAVKEDGEFIDPTGYREQLDTFSGEIDYEALRGELSWYDFDGKMELFIEEQKEELKQEMVDFIITGLKALGLVIVDLSYAVSLIGGGILITLRVAGLRKATGYFWILQLVNIFIKGLLGGVV